MVQIIEQVPLTEQERGRLQAQVSEIHNLEDLLNWASALEPPVPSPEVVTQDEYTHDVLVPVTDGRVLAFDTS